MKFHIISLKSYLAERLWLRPAAFGIIAIGPCLPAQWMPGLPAQSTRALQRSHDAMSNQHDLERVAAAARLS